MPHTGKLAARQLSSIQHELAAAGSRIGALDHATLARQIKLAGIPAPTGAEGARAAVVAGAFGELGFTTQTDRAGNVIATHVGATSNRRLAPVVCMAHLDTVFDASTSLAVFRDGNRYVCPGIGDNGRGLAVLVTLAQLVHEQLHNSPPLRRPIQFVATVGEEGLGNLRGVRAYFADRAEHALPLPHAVLVLDGPGDQNIVHHALGSRRYRVAFDGAGGHSWVDFGAPNAVHAASRAVAWLANVPRNLNGRVALTVSGIGGGESMNAVPAHSWFEVDVRATEQHLLTQVDAELRQLVNAAFVAEVGPQSGTMRASSQFAHAVSAFRSHITLLGERPSGMLPAEHPLVRLAQAASHLHNIEPVSAIASTDANIPLSLGIPAITIGGGGTGGGAHTVHEWYENVDAPRGVSRAFALLAALTLQD